MLILIILLFITMLYVMSVVYFSPKIEMKTRYKDDLRPCSTTNSKYDSIIVYFNVFCYLFIKKIKYLRKIEYYDLKIKYYDDVSNAEKKTKKKYLTDNEICEYKKIKRFLKLEKLKKH